MTKSILFVFILIVAFMGHAKELDFSQMSDDEKQITGIDKLNSAEKDALLRWITQKQQALIMAERKKNLGLTDSKRSYDKDQFKALLVKQYSNQAGEDFYQLDNGQVWKKMSSGHITLPSDSPMIVTLESGAFTSWFMRGEGNRSVKVKRIK